MAGSCVAKTPPHEARQSGTPPNQIQSIYFMTYKETLDTLYNMMPDFQNVGADAYKPGLDRVTEFNLFLGYPDLAFRSVHIAGTNGKGSVSHMTASVLQAAGYRTGLYTSPHLVDFRERIRIDGEMIPEEEVVAFAEKHMNTMQAIGLSFFEATMCMAFDWFARSGVDVAVVEAGLGGRLDSTNILNPIAAVITNIGLDHQSFLGDTIAAIASEKAGIIKSGIPVVIGERDAQSVLVFEARALEVGAPLTFAEDRFRCTGSQKRARSQVFTIESLLDGTRFPIETDLLGDYQCRNVVTVLTVIDVLRESFTISPSAVEQGIATAAISTGLRGRWEILGHDPLVVCDTGHNAHGVRLVVDQIRGERYRKLFMVIGMVNDKDFAAILPLFPTDAYYIFTAPSVGRSLPAAELEAKGAQYGLRGESVAKVSDAVARAKQLAGPEDMIFIGGSNFTVAEII